MTIQPDSAGLEADTALEAHGDGRYTACLSDDWETFGPCGGYLAAIALRAAGEEAKRPRPVSISCTFLRSGQFGMTDLIVRPLVVSQRTTALEVEMRQGDVLLMKATVWCADSGLSGLDHDASKVPESDPPESLPELDSLIPPDKARPFPKFRSRIEERTMTYDFDSFRRPHGEPRILSWFRFRPGRPSTNPYVDGARSLLLIDTTQFPASGAAYKEFLPYVAKSLDLTVHFHNFAPENEWLLCEATAPYAREGILNGRSRVWDQNGLLLASGGQQMICRRR